MSGRYTALGLVLLFATSCDSRTPEPTPAQVCERLEKIRKDAGSDLAEGRDTCVKRQSELRDQDHHRWGCSAACLLQAKGQNAEIECVDLCWPPPDDSPAVESADPTPSGTTSSDVDADDFFGEDDQ